MIIPNELLIKHNIDCRDTQDDFVICQVFLVATDYICNKIVEGVCTWNDYAEEKYYRQIAREELSKYMESEGE